MLITVDPSAIAALGGNLFVGAVIWYKMGKVEGKLTGHCSRLDRLEDIADNKDKEG